MIARPVQLPSGCTSQAMAAWSPSFSTSFEMLGGKSAKRRVKSDQSWALEDSRHEKKPPAPTAMAHLKRGFRVQRSGSSTSMAPCYGTNRTMVGSRPAVFRPVVTEQAVSLCALFSQQGSASPNYSRPAPARNGAISHSSRPHPLPSYVGWAPRLARERAAWPPMPPRGK